jgi:hypothetical protein
MLRFQERFVAAGTGWKPALSVQMNKKELQCKNLHDLAMFFADLKTRFVATVSLFPAKSPTASE